MERHERKGQEGDMRGEPAFAWIFGGNPRFFFLFSTLGIFHKVKPYGCKVVNNYYIGLYNWCSYSS